jgi:hypothetical protein
MDRRVVARTEARRENDVSFDLIAAEPEARQSLYKIPGGVPAFVGDADDSTVHSRRTPTERQPAVLVLSR